MEAKSNFQIPTDILLHFMAGWIASSFTAIWFPAIWGIAVATLVGLLKELYDWKIKGTGADISDLTATITGGMTYFFILKFAEALSLL